MENDAAMARLGFGNGHGSPTEPVWPDMSRTGRHWYWDQMHFPRPVTPLTATMDLPCMVEGFTRAWNLLSRPLTSTRAIVVNGYVYYADLPFEGTEQERRERQARFEAEVEARAVHLLETWRRSFQPAIEAQIERIRTFHYEEASPGQLLDLLHEAREMRREQWMRHDLIVVPAVAIASRFFDLYEELFGPERSNEAALLLQGFPNHTLEADHELWQLSREALAHPPVAAVLRKFAPESLLPRLESMLEARPFLNRFGDYLDRFGWRSDTFELSDPSWYEAPEVPLALIQRYLNDDIPDPKQEFRHAVEVRERLTAESLQRLAGRPDDRARFLALLTRAQQYLPAQEDHNHLIDQQGRTVLRLPILALGRRFVEAGVINEPHDIFFLTVDEIGHTVLNGLQTAHQEVVAIRRADWESWKRLTPPLYLGVPPEEPSKAGQRFWGSRPETTFRDGVLRGMPASPGRVTGRARVALTLEEVQGLKHGEVLVCRGTVPTWTPFFAIAAAVVADSGGVLSHCAIVAREYGLPCVVGTRVGTVTIRDGQVVTVDGATGTVYLQ